MQNKGKYYITTAIAYTSGKPHIGNTYEIILADSIARYKRKDGYDVFFQTGTDEHGQKIELKAEEAGVTPKEFVDDVAGTIKGLWDLMDTSYDKFIRTTDSDHEKQVQKIFKKFYEQGDIYKGSYEGWYCTPCESFFTESQLVDGKCPDCGSSLVVRKGRYGEFVACSNYPTCKHIKKEEVEVVEICGCPNCDGMIIEKKSRKGKVFYGCNNLKEINYAGDESSWNSISNNSFNNNVCMENCNVKIYLTDEGPDYKII